MGVYYAPGEREEGSAAAFRGEKGRRRNPLSLRRWRESTLDCPRRKEEGEKNDGSFLFLKGKRSRFFAPIKKRRKRFAILSGGPASQPVLEKEEGGDEQPADGQEKKLPIRIKKRRRKRGEPGREPRRLFGGGREKPVGQLPLKEKKPLIIIGEKNRKGRAA